MKLVEALRHLYLNKIINSSSTKQKNNPNNLSTFNLLIFGDYLPENTLHQIKLLNGLSDFIFSKLKIIFKPHPACNLDIKKFNSKFNVTKEPISSLLTDANIAFCSATTSAAVDSYSYGLQVIIASDPANLNLSPLRDYKDVFFVQNSNELEEIIIKIFQSKTYCASPRCIFELSDDLNLWKNYFSLLLIFKPTFFYAFFRYIQR